MIKRLYAPEELDIFPIYGIFAADYDDAYLQEYIDRQNGFPLHQVFLVKKGHGEFVVRGKYFVLEEGDMFFLAADVPHSYRGLDDEFATCYLAFAGIGCKTVLDYYHIEEFGIYKQKNSGNFVVQLSSTVELMKNSNSFPPICSSAYTTVITFFETVTKRKSSPIEKVYNYLKNNYSAPLTLADLLEIYPYSKTKLCQEFASTYGMTIFEMLTKIRLQNAHDILTMDPNIRLKMVMDTCGFNDMSYFCKMYKREYKTSPKAQLHKM